MALIYITCKDYKEAEKISLNLLKSRLIACANIFPIKSIYWWNSKLVKSRENVVIAKTNNTNFKKVVAAVTKIHSYKVPCILSLNDSANKEFEAWLSKEIR